MGHLYRQKAKGKDGVKRELPTWWIKYYRDGVPIRESTKTDKEQEARRILKAREGKVALGQPVSPRLDRIRYEELAEDLRQHYRTTGRRRAKEYEPRLGHLDRFFRGRRAVSIDPSLITAYVEDRQGQLTRRKQPPSNRTINIELDLLRRMLRLAYEQNKLFRVPTIKKLKENPPRQGFFEREQYEAVRRRLKPDIQVAVAIGHTFGWRIRSEVLTLRRSQVDLKAGTLRLEPGTTKNTEGRVAYLTPELRTLLVQQLERVDRLSKRMGQIIPWVFPHLSGRTRRGKRIKDFVKAWATACIQAGVPWMLKHDFRRTAVRNLERSSVPRSWAMQITGHKTESVYRRYAIVSDADLQEASRRLAGIFPGIAGQDGLDAAVVNVQNG